MLKRAALALFSEQFLRHGDSDIQGLHHANDSRHELEGTQLLEQRIAFLLKHVRMHRAAMWIHASTRCALLTSTSQYSS